VTPPWQAYSRTGLDQQYSPSSRVPSLDAYLQEYAGLSAVARAVCAPRIGLSFGPQPHEQLDYFPSRWPKPPLLVFVHGGNWQALSRTESAFVAQAVHEAGAAYAAIDYGLAPQTHLEEMVATVRRSIAWLAERAEELGHSRHRIHVAGSSAGAHLVATAVLTSESTCCDVAGCVLLSGMYDLEPVRHTYVNDALQLDAERAWELSPVHHLASSLPPVVIARGGNETEEYQRQYDEMTTALQAHSKRVVPVVEPARNHFDLPYDLVAARTDLGDAVLGQLGAV
jgi:arylformamidase